VAQTTPVDCPAVPVFTAPIATDACDATVDITFSDATIPGSCAGTYLVQRIWTATDDCGNTAACIDTIVVRDITPPTIMCVTQTTPINCPNVPVFNPPIATDACDATVAITFVDVTTQGSCAGTYSVTRTWTAMDDCGNSVTCSNTIMVQDTTPPTGIPPAGVSDFNACIDDVLLLLPFNPVVAASGYTDNCGPVMAMPTDTVIQGDDCFWALTYVFKVVDLCGNILPDQQIIHIGFDQTAPTGMKPPPVLNLNACKATASQVYPFDPIYAASTYSDNCGGPVTAMYVSQNIIGTDCDWTLVYTFKVLDQCGNTLNNQNAIYKGSDKTPPTITCAAQTTPVDCPAVPVFTPPTATDVCDATVAITFTDVTTQGSCAGTYSVTRTWKATDDCGNTATCSRTIVVRDITAPTIVCATQNTPINCPEVPVFVAPIATDACDASVSVTFTDATTQGSCAGTYSVTRTWTATDDCGNSSTCSRTIVVQDITSPTIVCAEQTTPISCPSVPVFVAATATDACDATVTITFTDATTQGSCAGTYSVTRTWTATDDCGNSSTCSRTIVVRDVTAPEIVCPEIANVISCPATPNFGMAEAFDECDATVAITFTDVTTQGTCAGTYIVVRTWVATDDCGNSSMCTATIVVRDITAPTITCVAQTTPIDCPAVPVFNAPTATDACDATVDITFTDATTQGSCAGTYSVTRTWTATDDCGNTATCSGTVVVRDITAPTITCVAQTTPIDCPSVPVFNAPTATDACDATVDISFTDATTPGSCAGTYSVTRTWTAIDDCGNSSTCSRIIVVQDITPPTIICVAQNTPISCPSVPVFTAPTATDACDATVTIAFTDATTQGSCAGTYSVTRTWTATDDCGNSSTCSRTIVVRDVTAPEIVCPEIANVISCPATPNFGMAEAFDECDATVTITFTDATTQGSCAGTYSVTRTWLATDDCGNTATCTATIVVRDITAPTIACVEQTTPIDCPAVPVFNAPTATDACDATVDITFADATTQGSCAGTYSVTRTWTATDDCGNTSTCSRTIVVRDITPPTITCVAQTTPVDCPAVPVFTAPIATDACDATVDITFVDATTQGSCAGTYSVTRTWTAIDDCGNSATCSRTIMVRDITPPTITCATQNTPIECPAVPVFIAPAATDACDATVAITFVDVTTPGSCAGTYSVTRTWTATDDCGNTATCSRTIVVQDITPPVGVAPPGISDLNGCHDDATIVVPFDPVYAASTYSDNCGGPVTAIPTDTIIQGDDCFWVLRYVFKVVDVCGNELVNQQIIHFGSDKTPPTGMKPPPVTGLDGCKANAEALYPFDPVYAASTYSDNCGGPVTAMYVGSSVVGTDCDWVLIYNFKVLDECGNVLLNQNAIYSGSDMTAPIVTCVAQTTPVNCPAVPVFTPPTVVDCDTMVTITFTDVTTAGSCPGSYSITRTWTATDNCDQSGTCSATIVVVDNTPPTLVCATQNTPVNCPAVPVFIAPIATDACDGTVLVTFTDATTQGSCAGTYSVTRTWTATDDCGNTATCSATIMVRDVTAPTITCVAQTTPINCPSVPVFVAPTATDACDASVTIAFNDATTQGSCAGTYSVTRTWTATDDCGNTATCSGTIMVRDVTPPEIVCPEIANVISCPATPNFGMAEAFDECDASVAITFSDVTTQGTCAGTYIVVRTWVAMDDCGNSATCVATIVVRDITAPTITCVAQTTPIDCPAVPVFTPPTATDACDATVDITFADATTQGSCAGTYSVTRTWTATDDCGNTATCSGTIMVRDITPPTVTCVAQTTPIDCPAVPVFTPPVATDACDATVTVTFTDATTQGSCAGTYSVTRTWTGTDDCGNSASCSATIVVRDVTPPTVVCATQNTPVNCPAVPVFIAPTVTDACDATVTVTFSDATTQGSCTGTYSVTRTWTATDDCGNTATCSATIMVRDVTAPTITCVAQTTPINCPAVPVFNAPTATDACDASVTITFNDATTQGSCAGTYSVTRTWTATDDCGNTATCSGTIMVRDVTPPEIVCPEIANVISCPATPNFGMAEAFDECDASVAITFSDVTTQGTCAGTYIVVRTWVAMDDCGNSATCVATIVVRDITAPTITCVAQTTPIDCPAVPVFTPPTATDACDATVDITFADATTQGSCAGTYSVTRTWTATDDCGNTATCSGTIMVRDITPPTVTCVAQTTPIDCPAVPVFTPPVATDACDATVTVTFTDATTQGSCAGTYSVTRTWTGTDDCGNSASCSATIVVRDVTPPTVVCATQNTPVNCPAVPVFIAPTVTDACDATVTVTFSDATTQGSCTGTYSVTRTWTATDDCGNTATCSATIMVRDVTAPTITCVAQTTPINCPAVPVFNAPTATDACDATVTITFSDATTQGSCAGTYSVTRTWTATDDCGNTATCSATIMVRDVTAPTITCVAQTTPINCPAVPVFNAPTATDACDATVTITFNDATTQGSCAGTYSVTRTWTATDDCGNTATCSGTIVVRDITAPTITCVAQTSPVNCPAVPVFIPPTATDACDATVMITFTDATTPGSCVGTYSVTRTWTATDDCGNTATCSGTIVVQDITPPVCATQDITVDVDQMAGFVTITASQVNNGSMDSCSSVTLSVNPATFTCEDAGENIVTLTVTDLCGNTSTCTATVIVNTCYDTCVAINSWVYLEGSATDPTGLPIYSIPMRTSLNDLMVLPGQTLVDPFFGPKYTLPGQPYDIAPWNYFGNEGDGYDSGGDPMMGDAGYPSTVVDWVLVSLRSDSAGTGGPVCQAAALLHKGGYIEFVEPFDCCGIDLFASYYIVIEHRNHLIVMSHIPVPVVPGIDSSTITYDFRNQQSYVDDPFMIGIFAQQKELLPQLPGVYAMFAGNGNQTNTAFSDTDINFDDRTYWEGENGDIGEYRIGDYNLNGDTNFNDRVTWERNNGKFTSVPRN
jgi:hypothetical protein